MRSFDSDTLTALAQGNLIIRHFIWITPRDFDTGDQITPVGYWNDYGAIAVTAYDGNSGAPVSRTYAGSGKIADLDQIVHEVGIAVRSTSVSLNILDASVENLVRGYNLRKAPFEWHFGLLNVSDRNIVAALYPLFVGFVNTVKIATPGIGGQGGVVIEAASDTRRLTIKSGNKRSDENQRLRSDDRSFKFAEAMRSRELFWGTKKAAPGLSSTLQALNQSGPGRIVRGLIGR